MNSNFDYLEEELIEDFPEKDKTRALRRYNDKKHKNKKMDIIKKSKWWRNSLTTGNGDYYVYMNPFKKNIKKTANRKVRRSDVDNTYSYKKVYDVEWECF